MLNYILSSIRTELTYLVKLSTHCLQFHRQNLPSYLFRLVRVALCETSSLRFIFWEFFAEQCQYIRIFSFHHLPTRSLYQLLYFVVVGDF